jgi:acyl-[acyl-carrier-protein]-phospholipid O-acyltransferase / long-chain-fatty-acid--[acyl-carrier-protein] ligase
MVESMTVPEPLLISRRFGPLFATQFLGAFNGNLVKTAMLFLLVFGGPADGSDSGGAMVSIAAAVFVTPMVIFSAYAGSLADAHDKATMAQMSKRAEVGAVIIAAVAIALHSTAAMLASLFLLGTVSAFFGPIKYAIIPQHVGADEIVGATGLVEAGTFVAILTGQIVAGLMPPSGAALLATGIAIAGVITARAIPPAPSQAPMASAPLRPLAATLDVLGGVRRQRATYLVILAISWFWAVGAILTSQLAVIASDVLHAAPAIATVMLAMFSIGVAAGSLLAARLLHHAVDVRQAGVAAAAMSIALGGFLWMVASVAPATEVASVATFMTQPLALPMLAALAMMATAGGVFVVPLYALLQTLGDPARRSRDVAANNILNAIFMVGGTGVAAGLAFAGLGPVAVLSVVVVANLGVAMVLIRGSKSVVAPPAQAAIR